jgi:hypothetical protein
VKVDLKPVRRETIGGRTNRPIIHITVTGSDKEAIKRAELHNIGEWKKINAAIAAHRARVSKGVEIAIELMTSHGSFSASGTKKGAEGPIGSACGNWNTGLEWGYYTPQETSMGPTVPPTTMKSRYSGCGGTSFTRETITPQIVTSAIGSFTI